MANKWHVFSADHEIPGQIMVDFKNAVGADEIIPYFEKHGITTIDPTIWYPMQPLLDVYNDMAESKGDIMFDFVAIGIKTAEQGIFPPEFASLPLIAILQGVPIVFKMNNRGTDIGSVDLEVIDDHHVKFTLRLCQPDDIWYGVFYGYVKRFSPPGTPFKLYYDNDVPRRDLGGEYTILHITWG